MLDPLAFKDPLLGLKEVLDGFKELSSMVSQGWQRNRGPFISLCQRCVQDPQGP